jgi:hypothetical protein
VPGLAGDAGGAALQLAVQGYARADAGADGQGDDVGERSGRFLVLLSGVVRDGAST